MNEEGSSVSRALVPAAWIASSLLVLESTVFYLHTYINHDVAWILSSTTRLMKGGVFGVDVVAVNPPLIWWITEPIVFVAGGLGLRLQDAFVITVAFLATIGILGYLWLCARPPRLLDRRSQALSAVVLFYVFFPGAFRDFGQREYIALLFALPYIATTAKRIKGGSLSLPIGSGIGVIAGIGFALKPYFLIVPLFIEIYGIVKSRRARFALRPETLGMLIVGCVYLVLLLLLAPAWLTDVVPKARLSYSAFQLPLIPVVQKIAPLLLVLLMMLVLSKNLRERELVDLLLLAAIGFSISYLAQMKGYTYHAFPVRALCLLIPATLLGQSEVDVDSSSSAGIGRLRKLAAIVALVLVLGRSGVVVAAWREWMKPGGRYAEQTDAIVAIIDEFAKDSTFLAISTHPYPAFPAVLYSSAKWVGHANSDLWLPAIAEHRSRRDQESTDAQIIENAAWDLLVRDLEQEPLLVLVDADSQHHGMGDLTFDLMGFCLEDQRIARAFKRYEERPRLGLYRVFVRRATEDIP